MNNVNIVLQLLKSLRPMESQNYEPTYSIYGSTDRLDPLLYSGSSWVKDKEDRIGSTWRQEAIRPDQDLQNQQLRRRNLALSRQFSNADQRMEKRRSWWRSRKRDFFNNRRYGKKRNQEGELKRVYLYVQGWAQVPWVMR